MIRDKLIRHKSRQKCTQVLPVLIMHKISYLPILSSSQIFLSLKFSVFSFFTVKRNYFTKICCVQTSLCLDSVPGNMECTYIYIMTSWIIRFSYFKLYPSFFFLKKYKVSYYSYEFSYIGSQISTLLEG